jgi:hypothetical protein
VGFGNWLRNLFSSGTREDEAAEREEYGMPDRGEAELRRDVGGGVGMTGGLAGEDAAEVAAEDLGELKPPRDPAP